MVKLALGCAALPSSAESRTCDGVTVRARIGGGLTILSVRQVVSSAASPSRSAAAGPVATAGNRGARGKRTKGHTTAGHRGALGVPLFTRAKTMTYSVGLM